MKELGEVVKLNGSTYILEKRIDDIAIYKQIRNDHTVAYELIIIRVAKPREIFGRTYPEQEVYPSSSEFGTHGWSYRTCSDAVNGMKDIIANRNILDTIKQAKRDS